MNGLWNNDVALERLVGYFKHLEDTGYTSQMTVFRLLLYCFLLDFVDTVPELVTDDDYEKIGKIMVCIFSGAGCLLPYKAFKDRHLQIGSTRYIGSFKLRRTTDDLARRTETNIYRAI